MSQHDGWLHRYVLLLYRYLKFYLQYAMGVLIGYAELKEPQS